VAEVIQCPSCQQKYPLRPGLVGKQLKCSKCGQMFRVAGAAAPKPPGRPAAPPVRASAPSADHEENGGPYAPEAEAATPAPSRKVKRPGKEKAASPEWTPMQKGALRAGLALLAFGTGAVILPLFGFQFVRLQKLGGDAPTAGVALAAIGMVLVAGALVSRARAALPSDSAAAAVARKGVKALKWAGVGVGGLFALLVALAVVNRLGLFIRQPAPLGPDFRQPPGPLPGANGVPPAGPGPAPTQPALPPGPDADYARVKGHFGADRVVRLIVTGAPGPDALTALVQRLEALVDPGQGRETATFTTGGKSTIILAPVPDLDAFVKKIDFATVTTVDRAERVITLTVDPAKLSKPKGS
jgi:hypothetical protein